MDHTWTTTFHQLSCSEEACFGGVERVNLACTDGLSKSVVAEHWLQTIATGSRISLGRREPKSPATASPSHNLRHCYYREEGRMLKASPVRRDRCGRFRRRAPSPDRRRYIRRKDQFAPTAHTSGTATVGEVLQCLAAVINSFHCFAGCGWVVILDALEYVLQVFDSKR